MLSVLWIPHLLILHPTHHSADRGATPHWLWAPQPQDGLCMHLHAFEKDMCARVSFKRSKLGDFKFTSKGSTLSQGFG